MSTIETFSPSEERRPENFEKIVFKAFLGPKQNITRTGFLGLIDVDLAAYGFMPQPVGVSYQGFSLVLTIITRSYPEQINSFKLEVDFKSIF